MNPLPRFVAIMLFVVLAALVALLAIPVWRGASPSDSAVESATHESPSRPADAPPSASARGYVFLGQAALILASAGLALTLTLILSQALSSRRRDSRNPFQTTRAEVSALARLAESSVAQGEELSHERDVRRLAEEDARFKQQLLTQSLDEKIRLGHDLHDGIVQSLYAAGLNLESVRALIKTNPDEADRRLETTRERLNEAIRDVRAYLVGLAPENLRRAGFAAALRAMLGELRAGREAEFDIRIDEDAAALFSPEQGIEALQIAREAVSNALRHGRATRITLRLMRSERELGLLVEDNGAGFDASRSRPGGHGLGNMRARAERLRATLEISSAPGEGARVLATVPLAESAA